ncbi:MAG: ComF family protein [Cyanobacteria bacterium P01_B01_bin.77]
MSLPQVLRQLTNIFLKAPCPLCHRSAIEVMCADCHRQLLACQWPESPQGNTLSSANLGLSDNVLPVSSWGVYRGVLKQTLALLKYGQQADLGIWLGYQLGKYWQTGKSYYSHTQNPVVMPIPLHTKRLKQRGYNQAALIAQGFCRVTGFSLAEHALVRTKATNAMHSLGVHERQANLTGAFQLGTKLPSRFRPVLLIDDIYTTGTTAHAAVLPLTEAGYSITGITTVARAVFVSPSAR